MMSYISGGWWRWKFRKVLLLVLLQVCLATSAVLSCQVDCNQVLTAPLGSFTSPCYPGDYPKSLACKWTLQAPAGFVVQLTFADFELEEALGCIYDRVTVNTGSNDVKFCGITAHGLTLNSTGNVMELSFNSDFSVQKKGFNITYRQVAVALRNQKVRIPQGNKDFAQASSHIPMPTLQQFTFCFEIARDKQKNKETIFSYEKSGTDILVFGMSETQMALTINSVECGLGTILNQSDFTSTMKPFCFTWSSTSGRVAMYSNGYRTKSCAGSKLQTLDGGGDFRLGARSHGFHGDLYNFRLWDYAMTRAQLTDLTCDVVGNVLDWENSYWDIPSSHAQTDSSLSCSTATPTPTSPTTSCASSGMGCPASTVTTSTAPTVSTSTTGTNPTSTVQSTTTSVTTSTPLTSISTDVQSTSTSSATTTSMTTSPTTTPASTVTTSTAPTVSTSTTGTNPTSTVQSTTTSVTTSTPLTSISTVQSTSTSPATTTSMTTSPTTTPATILTSATASAVSTSTTGTNPTSTVQSTTTSVTTSTPLTSISTDEGLYYRLSFLVNDNQARISEMEVEQIIALWLNQTLQNWTYSMYVVNVSIQLSDVDGKSSDTKRYTGQALLIYKYTMESPLEEAAIEGRLLKRNLTAESDLVLDGLVVEAVENCDAEEKPTHYNWPESRPTVTQFAPCFPNKALNASRTCMLNLHNYTSFWDSPDFTNCTDIDGIEVSAENAAEVVTQLADITQKELSTNEVSKVVTKLKEIVNVAKINASLATSMVTVFSNVMTSSDKVLVGASELALKTVEEMVQKIVFEGPSLSITSQNLALGISALNTSDYNGTSFSAFMSPDTADVQIDFEAEQRNPLAAVTLPPTLLSDLSDADVELISRINFMFFSKTGLFQDQTSNGLNLSSFVVASSVGNQTIRNLPDPVQIEIVHLQNQSNPKPVCVFWDFSIKDGNGGWNSDGCTVSPESNEYKTICLCDHLTHFGILMDISGSAEKMDAQNNKILTFITYIGCGISAIFSAATLLTYIAFEKLRRDYPSKILMNLSTSLLFLNMVFLLDGWLASSDKEGLCVAVAVFLHYFLLTSFTWMGLESVHMYIALVKVFNTYIRRYILKFCIVGWGLPATIVAIVVAIDRKFYGKEFYGKEKNGQGSSEFCWIKSQLIFYITCVGYFCVVFLLNVAMFIVVMMQICGRNGKRSNRTLREEVLRNLRSVVSLTFLLGMTWGFAFFAWGPVNLAFMYLFSIFNSLQGLFIFIFHCAMKENVQKQWRRYLCCGKFRLAENSDWSKTATNNTKKVSSDNIGKSLSSSSFGSSTANWTSKAKASLNPFTKRSSNTGKGYAIQTSPKFSPAVGDPSSSIIPVHQVIDKVKGYCSVRSDNFYKNIIMSDSFSHSTKF
ncbi:adhesion G-protein coupled receptor G6 isoform X2 [Conger conger]|uniref:adhesion G-protein coupled receptor G6 isoform X2 n=1 Tax=Conger conger TaxID=82655 RepID=UPI002A5A6C0F|nr:adhesion G-protein coupled receptor G6 isoform X2 [Conger conger]